MNMPWHQHQQQVVKGGFILKSRMSLREMRSLSSGQSIIVCYTSHLSEEFQRSDVCIILVKSEKTMHEKAVAAYQKESRQENIAQV
jgi:ABC-type multidrug transport system ATPase subunit